MDERLDVPAAKSRCSTRATRQAPGRGVERHAGAGHAAADHDDVERLVAHAAEVPGALGEVQRLHRVDSVHRVFLPVDRPGSGSAGGAPGGESDPGAEQCGMTTGGLSGSSRRVPSRRTLLRTAVGGVVVGVTLAGAALAGVVATPGPDAVDDALGAATGAAGDALGGAPGDGSDGSTEVFAAVGSEIAPTGMRVGASKRSIAPRPDDFGGTWVTDPAACRALDPGFLERLGTTPEDAAHLAAHRLALAGEPGLHLHGRLRASAR